MSHYRPGQAHVRVALHRINEHGRIAVGCAKPREATSDPLDVLPTELKLLSGNTDCALHRALLTQHFLDYAANQLRGIAQQSELLAVAQQQPERVADQVCCGLVTGTDQQHRSGEQLVLCGKR